MRETVIESHYSSTVISRPMEGSISPGLVSPPSVGTPPLSIGVCGNSHGNIPNGLEKAQLEEAVNQALQRGDTLRSRERTPAGSSPSRKRQRVYGDRFVGFLRHIANSLVPSTSSADWALGNSKKRMDIGYHKQSARLTMALLRFIPNREGQDLSASYSLLHHDASPTTPSRQKKRTPNGELHYQKSKS